MFEFGPGVVPCWQVDERDERTMRTSPSKRGLGLFEVGGGEQSTIPRILGSKTMIPTYKDEHPRDDGVKEIKNRVFYSYSQLTCCTNARLAVQTAIDRNC